MSCMGPRKKTKKGLSPDDFGGPERAQTETPKGSAKSGSKFGIKAAKTSPNMLTPDAATKKSGIPTRTTRIRASSIGSNSATSPSASPRSSLDPNGTTGKTIKKTASTNSLRSVASTAAASRTSRNASPAPSTSKANNSHTRTSSTTSSKKSPIAQMREDFDDLKQKNEQTLNMLSEKDSLLASQAAELEALRAQLGSPSPADDNQVVVGKEEYAKLVALSDETMQTLAEKDSVLRAREQELEELRVRLETERNEVAAITAGDLPTIIVSEQEDTVKGLKEQNDATLQLLAEKEQLLHVREQEIEGMRLKWEQERAEAVKPALEGVNAQLNVLKGENEEALTRLAERESELEALRAQLEAERSLGAEEEEKRSRLKRLTVDLEQDRENLAKLEQLNAELEEQKRMHEAVLVAHAQAMEEKDALLRQHEAAIASLEKSHEEVFRELQKQQAQANAELRLRHNAELAELRTKLENAEKNAASGAAPIQQLFNAEVEKLLAEIEAEEHNHAVQLDEFQRQQQQQLSTLQDSQNAQLKTLKQRQTSEKKRLSWKSQHAPVDAVSWPAPQPLSILRKTNGPQERKSTTKAAIEEDQLLSELKPKDNKKVQLYYSSVSGNATIKKQQEHARSLLQSRNIAFDLVDITVSSVTLGYMREQSGQKDLPQLFVGGEFRGLYQDIISHVEGDDLETLLRPAARSQSNGTEDARHTDPNAPIRVFPAGPIQLPSLRPTAQGKAPRSVHIRQSRDEDAELLAELERELSAGKIDEDALQSL